MLNHSKIKTGNKIAKGNSSHSFKAGWGNNTVNYGSITGPAGIKFTGDGTAKYTFEESKYGATYKFYDSGFEMTDANLKAQSIVNTGWNQYGLVNIENAKNRLTEGEIWTDYLIAANAMMHILESSTKGISQTLMEQFLACAMFGQGYQQTKQNILDDFVEAAAGTSAKNFEELAKTIFDYTVINNMPE
jgi:hypothetical protein